MARPPALARLIALAVLALLLAVAAAPALGSYADEVRLAERYAPVVRLVEQGDDCGTGEPYTPIDVNVLFDEPTVALRGPWGNGDLIEVGPPASALTAQLWEYHLDFPGDPLDPGCEYEEWNDRITAGTAPTVYAHVARQADEPDRLALQYWFFYVFNDWNNLHEGDWEMIQLVFDASTPAEALETDPTEVGYSQHEGGERAEWGADKLEIVGGTHPVVYPAAGSHANFFGDAVYLGRSAEQGVGCDDTSGPHLQLDPAVGTIPSDPAAAGDAFPWIRYQGRWGEQQPAFYNGPTGPNMKEQWTEPITWTDTWRPGAYAIPGGGALGTSTTDFFCESIAAGSAVLRRLVSNPLPTIGLFAAVILLAGWGLSRATWTPTAPLRWARRRTWGQILSASWRMYRRRFLLFVGIGVLFVPIAFVIGFVQWLLVKAEGVGSVTNAGEVAGVAALVAVVVGTALTLLSNGLVQAATLRALIEVDEGRPVTPLGAYRLIVPRIRPLLGSLLAAVVVITVLSFSLFLVPLAIWLAVRWALLVPSVVVDGRRAFSALQRSGSLVRGHWLKVGSLAIVGGGAVILAGPIVGMILILVTSAPFWVLNVVAAIVYAVALPFVGLVVSYVYADTRLGLEAGRERAVDELPAEGVIRP